MGMNSTDSNVAAPAIRDQLQNRTHSIPPSDVHHYCSHTHSPMNEFIRLIASCCVSKQTAKEYTRIPFQTKGLTQKLKL